MPQDLTRDSDRLLEQGRSLVHDNRAGGRHRRAVSVGRGSAELKAKHLATKLAQLAVGVVGVLVAAGVAGMILNGIGFWGVMATVLAIGAVFAVVTSRKIKVPRLKDINTGDVRHMVARTELWLEHQRPALPPPAVTLVDQIGVQLDALGVQLEHVDPLHPAAVETRKLVGETLPGMIDAWRKIPANLRREERAGGATPDQQLAESLGKISGEIDRVTRQLADGALDDLAIRTRYLDYRYGAEGEPEALPQALPAPDPLEQLNRLPERDAQKSSLEP
jgi:hypothetical protein